MARRHTLTSPEERRLPRKGRTRVRLRLAYVERLVDKDGVPLYAAVSDKDGKIIKERAPRWALRRIAFQSRLHNDRREWGALPRNIRLWREKINADLGAES